MQLPQLVTTLVETGLSYLINEGCKAVVEALDLVLLVRANGLDGGVDVQVERCQQALVDRHRGDGTPQVRPSAGHLGAGIRPQGHAAETPRQAVQAGAAAALVPQTHGWVGWLVVVVALCGEDVPAGVERG